MAVIYLLGVEIEYQNRRNVVQLLSRSPSLLWQLAMFIQTFIHFPLPTHATIPVTTFHSSSVSSPLSTASRQQQLFSKPETPTQPTKLSLHSQINNITMSLPTGQAQLIVAVFEQLKEKGCLTIDFKPIQEKLGVNTASTMRGKWFRLMKDLDSGKLLSDMTGGATTRSTTGTPKKSGKAKAVGKHAREEEEVNGNGEEEGVSPTKKPRGIKPKKEEIKVEPELEEEHTGFDGEDMYE
ncbi:hypothetical protein B0J14DRAFT_266945 [Halenospora varia]|nr:hypothetical protein B0J14DRAFT_266945 [Halenospora varia]